LGAGAGLAAAGGGVAGLGAGHIMLPSCSTMLPRTTSSLKSILNVDLPSPMDSSSFVMLLPYSVDACVGSRDGMSV
jgi:hypothetical protein